jgi:thiamine biosynthesis lipoprotein
MSQRPATADWRALGVHVRLAVTDPAALDTAQALLSHDLAALDAACSRFRPDSELRRLDDAGGRPTRVSPLLAEAIGVALEAARRTDGDVDPTVGGALAELGYDLSLEQLPADGPRVRVVPQATAGWHRVELDRERRLVTVPRGVRLDLGATAKAWAADRSAQRIHQRLGTGALVALGGDLSALGPTPPGGWLVRVQDRTGPVEDDAPGPTHLVGLHGGGLATSSTSSRRWRRGGDVLHHVLDPRSGLPARTPWRTVTVAAASCLLANTASTAAVIRAERATGWLSRLGLAARLVDHDGAVTLVGGWPRADEQVAS